VAALTLALLVGPQQLEIGPSMIKFILIDQCNIGITPLVIGMTVTTGVIVEPSMQPSLVSYVGRNILVAIQTKLGLGLFIEMLVALFALVLVLGMPGDDFARHQNLFDRLRPSPTENQQGENQPKNTK